MNRPSFALSILLAALGGPLFMAGVARSESLDQQTVCTPPVSAVHPVDLYHCPLPCPGYMDEYEAAAADGGLANVENWQDFVTSSQNSLTKAVTDKYDDLFDTLNEATEQAIAAMTPAVVEADPSDYNADPPTATKYEPYAEGAADTVENNADTTAETSDTSSVEAYESEFSGYDSAEYLEENYGYTPVKEFDLDKLVAARRISASTVLFHLVDRALDLEIVADARQYATEGYSLYQQLSCEYPLDRLVDASESAWYHIAEHNRLANHPATDFADNSYSGYRLPYDHCGWDAEFTEYNWRRSLVVPAPAAEVPSVQASVQRDALLTIARSLRSLASQVEAASTWVAELGGIDVAEISHSSTAR